MSTLIFYCFAAAGFVSVLWYCVYDKWRVLPKWIKCNFCAFWWLSVLVSVAPALLHGIVFESLTAPLIVWAFANIIYTTVKMNQ